MVQDALIQRADVQRRARIEPDQAGERLDKAAARAFPEYSRTQLSQWIRSGALTLDGARALPKHKVNGCEWLAIDAPDPAGSARWDAPQVVDFRVVYEDRDVLVVDKPPGLVVHPGAGNPDRTLVNGLLAYRPSLGVLPRAGLVHRIDKDTGGLLAVGATAESFRLLTRAIAKHRFVRRYAAVVEGVLTGGRDIEASIGRDPHDRLRQRVSETGRRALTRVRVRERFRAATLIDAELETGRTHQIRVHLASIGHPLLGDVRYGARGRLPLQPTTTLVATMRSFRRQALHAFALGFQHPVEERWLEFESAVPPDFETLLKVLRADRDEARDDHT